MRQQGVEHRLARSGNRRATISMLHRHELSPVCVPNHGTSLLTNQHSRQVIPRPVGIHATVDIPVKTPARHGAQIKGNGAQYTGLAPHRSPRWEPVEAYDGVPHIGHSRARNRQPIPPGSSPTDRIETFTGGLIDNDRCQWPVGIHCAHAGGKPRDPSRAICGPIDRVKHNGNFTGAGMA